MSTSLLKLFLNIEWFSIMFSIPLLKSSNLIIEFMGKYDRISETITMHVSK